MPDEDALQESKERYHFLVEQASDIILLYDLDTNCILEGNLAFHRLLGYSIEDISGLSIYDIVAHDRESIDSNIEKTKEKKQCFVGQRKYRKKDGSLLDVEVCVHLFFIEGKGILCSVARDITARKLAEEALRKSEQEKAAILDGLKTVSVEYLDPQMRIVWLNSAVQKHLHLSEDEIRGKRCFEIIQGLESPCPGCTALKALQTDESQEGELVTPDGKVWISHSNVIKDANGDVTGVVHVAVNISERKRSEKALQESENMYRAIFENTGTGMVIDDDNTVISLANSEFEKLTGYSKEEIEGKISWTEFVVKEDLERVLQQHKLRRVYPNAALRCYEFGIRDRNGLNKNILLHVDVIPGTKKSVASMMDITERKLAENALQESENMYRAIFENTGTATMIIEDDTIVSLANSGLERLSGYSKEEIEGKISWTEFVVKEDLERMLEQHKLRRGDPNAALNNYEFRAIDRNGKVKDILLHVGIIPGTKKSIASLLDITDRKRVEEALRESKEQYRILAESSQDMIYVIDRDDEIEYVNGTAARVLGLQPEKIIGMPRSSFFPKEIADRQKLHLNKVFETGLPDHTEGVIIAGGRDMWQDTCLTPLKNDDNETYAVLGISRDITERKQAENALRESEEKYRTLVENLDEGIQVVNQDGTIVFANQRMEEMVGYGRGELVGRNALEMMDNRSRELAIAGMKRDLAEESKTQMELLQFHKNGTPINVSLRGTSIKSLTGETLFLAAISDITDRKRAEAALRESETRYHTLFDAGKDSIFLFPLKADGMPLNFIDVNAVACQVYGYTRDEFLTMSPSDLIAPEYHEKMPALGAELIETGKMRAEWDDICKDGHRIPVDVSATLFELGGEPICMAVVRDITERKQTEEALKAERDMAEQYLNTVEVILVALDTEARITLLNRKGYQVLGYEEGELIGRDWIKTCLRPQDHEAVHEANRKIISGKIELFEYYESYILTKNGEERSIAWHTKIIKNKEGGIIGTLSSGEDTTERKKAEEMILQLAAIVESSNDAIFGSRLDGTITSWNKGAEGIYGYTENEIIGQPLPLLASPERLDEVPRILERLRQGEHIDHYESLCRRKDGEQFPVDLTISPIYDIKGKIVGTSTIVRDITERKRAEEALKHSEQLFSSMIQQSAMATFVVDSEHKVLYWNKACEELTGIEAEKMIGTSNQWHAFYANPRPCLADVVVDNKTEYLDELYEIHSRSKLAPNGLHAEGWYHNLGGKDRYILFDAAPIHGNDGKMIAVIETLQDITERKHAEDALRASESKLASIIEFLPDATFVVDTEGKVIAWNRAIEEMTGVPKENMIGHGNHEYTIPFYGERRKHLLDLIELDDKDLVSKYQYVQRIGDTLYAEAFTPALYGGKGAYVRATGAPLFDNKGTRIGAIESIRDITEARNATITLKEQYNFLQQLIDSIPNPIFLKDTEGLYLGCNKAFEAFTGHPRDKIVGHNIYDLYPKDLADIYQDADNRLLQNPGVQQYESSMAHTDGSRREVIFSKATHFDIEGRLAGIVGVVLDITERKRMEEALRESERRMAEIIDFLPDATLVIDTEGEVIAWNRAIEVMTGIKAQEILGKGDYEYSLPFYGQRRPILVDLVLRSKSEIEKRYSDLKWTDGTLVGYAFTPNLRGGVGAYLWGVASPIYDIHGKIVGAIESIKDITEQKRMEKDLQESKDYLDKIINSIGDPLFVKDRSHKFVLVNDAMCNLMGKPYADIIGHTDQEFFPREQVEVFLDKDEEVFRTEGENINEEQITDAQGIIHTIITKKTLYTDNTGNQSLVGIIRDITERKQAEDRINASLKEKEVLLKEVHHRVKNNLGIISALLSLQSSYLTDADLIKIFRDSQNRIKSMALIHENLYRSQNLDKVDLNEYINQLVSYLSQSYGDLAGKIKFKVKSEKVYLNINTAIPCGMIINELVSNSFKYAFPDGRSGEICVDLRSEDDGFRLVVRDNGVGIKGETNIKESKTLGFRLIDTLVKQIHGEMNLDTINGVRCEIHFKGLK